MYSGCLWIGLVTAVILVHLISYGRCMKISPYPDHPVDVRKGKRAVTSSPEGEELPTCGGNLSATSLRRQLSSPNYPDHYPSGVFCEWTITSNGNISILFKLVEIELDADCQFDYLEVQVGVPPQPLNKICGNAANELIVTNSTAVTLTFKSDAEYTERGFLLEYYTDSVHRDEAVNGDCSRKLVGDSGNVTSPNYPQKYPPSSNCSTLISVQPGKVIVLKFQDIVLEYEKSCPFDFVELYDGPSPGFPLLGRFCSNSQKRVLRSSGHNVLVLFRSDDLISLKGFLLQYEMSSNDVISSAKGCSPAPEVRNGTIAFPSDTIAWPVNYSCLVELEAPPDLTIAISVLNDSHATAWNCSSHYVRVYDNKLNEAWTPLPPICGNDFNSSQEVFSTGNKTRLEFYSNQSLGFRHFVASYKLLPFSSVTQNRTPEKVVNVPASELVDEVPTSTNVPRGASHIMKCSPKFPGASITWNKDNIILSGSRPLDDLYVVSPTTLWIRKMHEELSGVYTCVVSQDNRKAEASAAIQISAAERPRQCDMSFYKAVGDQRLTEGALAIMQCVVLDVPASQVDIAWLRNGLPFPESDRHSVVKEFGMVYIQSVLPDDSAVYTCHATDLRSNCAIEKSAVLSVTPPVNVEQICGQPSAGKPRLVKPHVNHGKISGGNDTIKGAYPWQVMFWTELENAFCGGTLLSNQWVLTAAHCFSVRDIPIEDVEVRLGKHDQYKDEPEQFVTGIQELHMHPRYDPARPGAKFDNDIALVRLEESAEYTDYIAPACLGSDVELNREYFNESVEVLGTVTGWGQLTEFGQVPRYLKEIRLPIVDEKACQNAVSDKMWVTPNMFCAGFEQEIIGDACQGDSGGPFLVKHNERWHVIGIVSWGEGCGVLPTYDSSIQRVEDDQKEQWKQLRNALEIMRIINETTATEDVVVLMYLLGEGKLNLDFEQQLQEEEMHHLRSIASVFINICYSEQEAYWLTVNFWKLLKSLKIDTSQMSKQMEDILDKDDHELYQHLLKLKVVPALPADAWFQGCFADVLDTDVLLRVWDRVIGGSTKILPQVAATLLTSLRSSLIQQKTASDVLQAIENVPKEASSAIVSKILT